MTYEVQPLPFKPNRLEGLSDRPLITHYESNYDGAARRLSALERGLEQADWAAALAGFELNGLGRERLIATLGKPTNQWVAADHRHTLADGALVLAPDVYGHAYAVALGRSSQCGTHWADGGQSCFSVPSS